MQQLTPKELETLLSAGEGTHNCHDGNPTWHDPLTDMESLGLSFFGHDGGGGCKDYYALTDEGKKVREYLITLLPRSFCTRADSGFAAGFGHTPFNALAPGRNLRESSGAR